MQPAISYAGVVSPNTWNRHDTLWVLGIYGCAVSSGSLFLPISLGLAGFWPMLFLSLLAFPVTYYTYRSLGKFIQSAGTAGGREGNIIDAVEQNLGVRWAKCITCLYFFTVFPALMVYTITITNTVIDFISSQLHLGEISRFIVAPLATLFLVMLTRGNTTFIVKIMGFIVFPFIVSLVLISFFAVPSWNLSYMTTAHNFGGVEGLASSVWGSLSMIVYAFSFTSIASSFVVAQKKAYGDEAPRKISKIMYVAVVLVVSTVIFFSWSCIFALSPVELAEAKANNLTVLSYLAKKFESPWLASAPQLIVFTATIKSFLAHFLATKESVKGFASVCFGCKPEVVHGKALQHALAIFILIVTTIPAILNWNVLSLIKIGMVPVSIFIVFLLPQYAFARVPALRKYRGGVANWFVLAIGVLCLIDAFLMAFK